MTESSKQEIEMKIRSSEVEIAVLILEEQRKTNALLGALVEALAEEMPEEEQPATTYMDGSAVR